MSEKDLEKEVLEEDDGFEIIDVADENGNVTQYYLVDIRDYKGKQYAFLVPAEEIDEDADAVSIFEISGDDESGILLPLDDDTLMEELFADFMADYDPEYTEDDGDLVN